MSALDVAQAICRLARRPRPGGERGAGSGSGGGARPEAPTELVDGRWQVVGASRGGAVATPTRIARRIAQGAAPVAAGAAITGGTLLVCQALGLPEALMPAGRWPSADGAMARTGRAPALPGAVSTGDGIGLLMSGPSLFAPDTLLQEPAGMREQIVQSTHTEPAPVPEPSSIELFGGVLALLAGVVLIGAARKRRAHRVQ